MSSSTQCPRVWPGVGMARNPGASSIGVEAVENALGIGLRGKFQAMDDAGRAETRGILIGVGDIVAMRQEDVADAAQLGEAARQVLHEARRIDQPVAVGMLHEIAVAAEGFAAN